MPRCFSLRRILPVLLVLLLVGGLAAGCAPIPRSDARLRIVTTVFPTYDWVRVILGDRAEGVELIRIPETGVDLHSHQASPGDIIRVLDADLVIRVGGPSDDWVSEALGSSSSDAVVLNLFEILGNDLREEELIEGMEEEEEEEEGPEYDEHVWLSLRHAARFCRVIAETLGRLDPENRSVYDANVAAYTAELDRLDREFAEAAASSPRDTILVADRFPFRYLIEDYGISYYAAFAGCSAETEASFETVSFLIEKTDELRLSVILVLEKNEKSALAETIRSHSASQDQKILALHSLQSVTGQEAETASYLSLMAENLAVLREALA